MKRYDLEDRTKKFAKDIREFVQKLPRTISNIEDIKQLVRASGSVGANYIEANDSISKKDFLLRIKICRKESKESCYWLELLDLVDNEGFEQDRQILMKESRELMMIFGSILRNSLNKSEPILN